MCVGGGGGGQQNKQRLEGTDGEILKSHERCASQTKNILILMWIDEITRNKKRINEKMVVILKLILFSKEQKFV